MTHLSVSPVPTTAKTFPHFVGTGDWPVASALSMLRGVLEGGADDMSEVDAVFHAALLICIMLLSLNPWIPGFSVSDDGAVAEEASMVAVGGDGLISMLLSGTMDRPAALVEEASMVVVGGQGLLALLLLGTMDGVAVLRASLRSVSWYNSSLLERLVKLGKSNKFTHRGSAKVIFGCWWYLLGFSGCLNSRYLV